MPARLLSIDANFSKSIITNYYILTKAQMLYLMTVAMDPPT